MMGEPSEFYHIFPFEFPRLTERGLVGSILQRDYVGTVSPDSLLSTGKLVVAIVMLVTCCDFHATLIIPRTFHPTADGHLSTLLK